MAELPDVKVTQAPELLADVLHVVKQILTRQISREQASRWAVTPFADFPTVEEDTVEGKVVFYTLSRLIDDDWTPDGEDWPELMDLQRMLEGRAARRNHGALTGEARRKRLLMSGRDLWDNGDITGRRLVIRGML